MNCRIKWISRNLAACYSNNVSDDPVLVVMWHFWVSNGDWTHFSNFSHLFVTMCKSLWIKASAKWRNVHVNRLKMGLDELQVKIRSIEEWLNVHTHWLDKRWLSLSLSENHTWSISVLSVQRLHERMQTSKSIAIMAFPNGCALKWWTWTGSRNTKLCQHCSSVHFSVGLEISIFHMP